MNATEIQSDLNWVDVCAADELVANLGVRALIGSEQIAIFKVQDKLYALNAMDPFSNAAVLSRGIVGDLKGNLVVASPIYKQHFILGTGVCLEDESVSVPVYSVKEHNGRVFVAA